MAIISNNAYLAIENPTTREIQDQVKNLTKQVIALILLEDGQVRKYMEPGYEEERTKEGPHE